MADANVQKQIDDINQKLDLLLEYVNEQRLKQNVVTDLIDDVSRIGTDMFKSTVTELENQGIELDMEELKIMIFRFIKNIKTFNYLLETLQSATDFMKDAGPIAREMIIDLTHEFHKLEEKGVIDAYKTIFRNLADPRIMNSLAHITNVLANTSIDDKVDDKSLFKLFKELKSPEMRKGLSYTMRVVKEISRKPDSNTKVLTINNK